jgi:hypothetical protein
VVDIDTCTVANAEAVNRVVLDVDVMDRAGSKHFVHFDEVVGPFLRSVVSYIMNGNTHFATPPLLPRPSHQALPLPSRTALAAAVISMSVPPTLMNG